MIILSLCPRALMATMMALPHAPRCCSQLRPSLCAAHTQSTPPFPTFSSFFFPPKSHFIHHMSSLTGKLKVAWGVGSRRGKKEKPTADYFPLCADSLFKCKTQANVITSVATETNGFMTPPSLTNRRILVRLLCFSATFPILII